jgi:hypothetical protein
MAVKNCLTGHGTSVYPNIEAFNLLICGGNS